MQANIPHIRIPMDILCRDDINRDELSVLCILIAFTDRRSRTVRIRQGRIAEYLGMSRAWVNPVIAKLERMNLLYRKSEFSGRSFTYCLSPVCLAATDTPDVPEKPCHDDDTSCQPADTVPRDSVPSSLTSEWETLHDNWTPTQAAWAKATQLYPDTDLEKHSSHFVLKVKSRGYRYLDHDQAWLDWLEQDHQRFPKHTPKPDCKRSSRDKSDDKGKGRGHDNEQSILDRLISTINDDYDISYDNGPEENRPPAGTGAELLAVLETLPG